MESSVACNDPGKLYHQCMLDVTAEPHRASRRLAPFFASSLKGLAAAPPPGNPQPDSLTSGAGIPSTYVIYIEHSTAGGSRVARKAKNITSPPIRPTDPSHAQRSPSIVIADFPGKPASVPHWAERRNQRIPQIVMTPSSQ